MKMMRCRRERAMPSHAERVGMQPGAHSSRRWRCETPNGNLALLVNEICDRGRGFAMSTTMNPDALRTLVCQAQVSSRAASGPMGGSTRGRAREGCVPGALLAKVRDESEQAHLGRASGIRALDKGARDEEAD
jgi:hypothetical protein